MNRSRTSRNNTRNKRSAIQPTLMRLLFLVTGEEYRIDEKAEFHRGERPLDDLITEHLAGDISLEVNPLGRSGETALHVVTFSLSDDMPHPFSKAKTFIEELAALAIPASIEVAEGGKGHYHVWIFHESPIPAQPFAQALGKLVNTITGIDLPVIPGKSTDKYAPLPLQGEMALMQRRVFVNTVGKMLKDQRGFLGEVSKCAKTDAERFLKEFGESIPGPVKVKSPDMPPSEPEQIALEILFHDTSPAENIEPATIKEDTPEEISRGIAVKPLHKPAEIPDSEKTAAIQKKHGSAAKIQPDEAVAVFDSDAPQSEYLTFFLGKQRYGIESRYIDGVLSKEHLTGLSDAKLGIAGIAAYENHMIPVIDPFTALHAESGHSIGNGKILVLKTDVGYYGMLVGKVGVVQPVPDDMLVPLHADADALMPGQTGTVRLDSSLELICLDAVRFLDFFPWTANQGEEEESPAFTESLLVLFSTSGTLFGVNGDVIHEIVSSPKHHERKAALQKSASRMEYEGRELPVVHFNSLLDPTTERQAVLEHDVLRTERVLVMAVEGILFGLEVDRIEGIRRKSLYRTSFPSELLSSIYNSNGLIRVQGENGFRFLLDPQTLLARIDLSAISA